MCQEVEDLTAKVAVEVTAEVTAKEREKAIKQMAKVCREFGAGPDATAKKLMEHYAISEADAKAYAAEAYKN